MVTTWSIAYLLGTGMSERLSASEMSEDSTTAPAACPHGLYRIVAIVFPPSLLSSLRHHFTSIAMAVSYIAPVQGTSDIRG